MTRTDITIYTFLGLLTFLGAGMLYSILGGGGLRSMGSPDFSVFEGFLHHLKNDVRVKSTTDLSWMDIYDEHGVNFGDQVYVGDGSQAAITTKSFQARIDENSLFTLSQANQESLIQLTRGGLEMDLVEGTSTAFDFNGKKISLSGKTKILLQRSEKAAESNLGLSILSGKARLVTPIGRVLPVKGGQAFSLMEDGKSGRLQFKVLTIRPQTPQEDQVFFGDQPIGFKWENKSGVFKKMELEISDSIAFQKILRSETLTKSEFSMGGLSAGRYFWRVKGDTGSAIISGPIGSFVIASEGVAKQLPPKIYFERPGVWAIEMLAQPSPYAGEYHYEVSTDPLFNKIIGQIRSAANPDRVLVHFNGDIYTRLRWKYRSSEKWTPWSEPIFLSTPSFQLAPVLTMGSLTSKGKYELTWTPVVGSAFYRVLQEDLSDRRLVNTLDVPKTATQVLPLNRRESQVWVRSHRSMEEFGYDSNRVILKGFVESPQLEPLNLKPRWLSRFKEHQLPELEMNIKVGLLSGEAVEIFYSPHPDMSEALSVKREAPGPFTLEVPLWKSYFVRAQVNLSDKKLFSLPSKVYSLPYPPLSSPSPPQVKLPKDDETIFVASKKFFISFVWLPVPEALGYEIIISKSKTFNTIYTLSESATNQYVIEKKLEDGTYYWKVRAFTHYIESEWSSVREFSIVNAIK